MPRKAKSAGRDVEVMPVSPISSAVDLAKPVRVVAMTEREAKAATAAIRALFHSMQHHWYDLGTQVKTGLDRSAPVALGMNGLDWMRQMFGERLSKVHRALRIARALERLPQEKVRELTEGNAYQLTRLPESMRNSEEWLVAAMGTENDEFADKAQEALEAKGHPKKEKFTNQFPRMPITFKPLLDEVEKKLAEVMELDLELKPQEVRFQIWERAVLMLHNTPVEFLQQELVGDDGSLPPQVSEEVA